MQDTLEIAAEKTTPARLEPARSKCVLLPFVMCGCSDLRTVR